MSATPDRRSAAGRNLCIVLGAVIVATMVFPSQAPGTSPALELANNGPAAMSAAYAYCDAENYGSRYVCKVLHGEETIAMWHDAQQDAPTEACHFAAVIADPILKGWSIRIYEGPRNENKRAVCVVGT